MNILTREKYNRSNETKINRKVYVHKKMYLIFDILFIYICYRCINIRNYR